MHDLRSVWDCQWKDERLCAAVPATNYCPIELISMSLLRHMIEQQVQTIPVAAGFHSSLKIFLSLFMLCPVAP